MKMKLKVTALFFAALFSLSANADIVTLGEADIFGYDADDIYLGGVYLGNDKHADNFMATTELTDVTELFRDEESFTGEVETRTGTVVKVDYLDYLVVKFDGAYGVYDVQKYAVGDELNWNAENFLKGCLALDPAAGNCYAATSHVTGYGVVPVPAAVWLFGSGLLGLVGVARRRSA